MASDSGSDKDNNSSPPPSHNPFIRFKQFADTQVSSLLQSITGLPSAIAKNPEGKARWADFDEDLRRRDELKARQRQLKNSEAGYQAQDSTAEQETEVPIWNGLGLGTRSNRDVPREMDVRAALDLPLYSPVHKSLFAHLDKRGDEHDDNFKPDNLVKTLRDGLMPEYWPFKLRPDQRSLDVMTTIRYLAYNDLNSDSSFYSNYSLLPYLLFSPYSPLVLSANNQHGSNGSSKSDGSFPYFAAFEDLLAETRSSPADSPDWDRRSYYAIYQPFPRAPLAMNGISWIQHLYEQNILQQKEIIPVTHRICWPDRYRNPILCVYTPPQEAATEQDMYDHFLRSASSPANAVDAVIKEGEGLFKELVGLLETPEGRDAFKEILNSKVKKDIKDIFGELVKLGKDLKTTQEKHEATVPRPLAGESSESLPNSSQDSNTVVSSATTSEHFKHEDGSIETTVTIWKRFADGHETTTTTNHCEDPADDDIDEAVADSHKKPENQANSKARSGWFWN